MTQRKIALSIEEAADYTGIGRNTLRQLLSVDKAIVNHKCYTNVRDRKNFYRKSG